MMSDHACVRGFVIDLKLNGHKLVMTVYRPNDNDNDKYIFLVRMPITEMIITLICFG